VLGRLLCKLGLHKWRELYGEVTECEDDFLLRYCFRCGKLQEAHSDFRYTGENPRALKTGRSDPEKVRVSLPLSPEYKTVWHIPTTNLSFPNNNRLGSKCLHGSNLLLKKLAQRARKTNR